MSKTLTKQQIYEKIIREMPSNLTEVELAAFIMKEIALARSFSSRYYWAYDNKTREYIYKASIKGRETSRETSKENKRQLICVTATKLFKDIAERLGLNIYIIGDTQLTKNDFTIYKLGEHVSPVVKTKEGKYIKVDVEWDLENIQTGRRWVKFGTKDEGQDMLTEISEEEINNIMKRIGFIKDENDYLENYIEGLGLSDQTFSARHRIDKLFSDKELTKRASRLKSSVDIYRFYRRIVNEYVHNDGNFALYGGYSQKHMNKEKKYTVFANLQENDEDFFWIWSSRERRMIATAKETMRQFFSKYLINVIPGKKDKEKCKTMLTRLGIGVLNKQSSKDKLDGILCR